MWFDITFGLALIAAILGWMALGRLKALTARVAALEALLGQGAAIPAPGAASPEPEEDGPWNVEATETAEPARSPAWSPPSLGGGVALQNLGRWLRANWIYPVAGAALVMAGIYLLQYSIDKGLLSPTARVVLGLGLGAVLILGAEFLRRRWGAAARLVPSTLAGAGIAGLLASVLAAHHLYDMLGQEATLAALAGVALLAMALGWVQGPLLAAIGVLAGAAAPFLLGEGGAPRPILFGYFGVVSAVGLGLGGLRRWGWIAALAVLAPLAGGVLIHAAGAPSSGLALLILAVIAMATALPGGALLPRAEGPMIHQARRARPAPEVLVAALAVLAGVLALVSQVKAPESILAAGALALFLPLWTRRAPALSDLSLIAAAALPAAIALSHLSTPLLLAYVLNAYRWLPIAAVALAALAGLAMVWRSEAATARARDLWALLAVATPGATAIAAELFWQPLVLLEFRWPATIMALAAGLTGLALWAARRDGGQGLRLGAATAAAVAMIALALMLLLSEAALTVALAVLMVASAAMDRRFDIPALGVILGLGAMTLGWRLVVDPGLDPLMSGAMNGLDTALTLLAVLAGPLAALALIRQAPAHPARDWGRIIAETALSGAVPIIIAVVLARMLDRVSVHAMLGIEGTALIALAWVQAARARRMAGSRAMHLVRRALAVLLGLGAGLALLLAVTLFSPVFGGGFLSDPVQGWPLVNDLALAYGLPALVLWWAVRGAGGRLARGARLAAILLGAVWIGHVIRHLWQGGAQMPLYHGFAQGELYAYTVALLIAGAASMTLALRLGVTTYRRVGLALIGLAAAKAFLIDAAGLTGLMRVGAFLGLGLSLAALAWLNAWVIARSGGGDGASRG